MPRADANRSVEHDGAVAKDEHAVLGVLLGIDDVATD
jgi:hypothetical protein